MDLHHIEFFGRDNKIVKILQKSLGISKIGKVKYEYNNYEYKSVVLKQENILLIFSSLIVKLNEKKNNSNYINFDHINTLLYKHGNGLYVLGIKVNNINEIFNLCKERNMNIILKPTNIKNKVIIFEVVIFGDVMIRFIEYFHFDGIFLPQYIPTTNISHQSNLNNIDHITGIVNNLTKTINYIKQIKDISTYEYFNNFSNVRSEILTNKDKTLFLSLIEQKLTTKTKCRFSATEFLKFNNGEGIQHIAFNSKNIIHTINEIKKMQVMEPDYSIKFMEVIPEYYEHPKVKEILNELTLYYMCDSEVIMKYGIMVDKDEKGILLQIFTKPILNNNYYFEIVQRYPKIKTNLMAGGFGKNNIEIIEDILMLS